MNRSLPHDTGRMEIGMLNSFSFCRLVSSKNSSSQQLKEGFKEDLKGQSLTCFIDLLRIHSDHGLHGWAWEVWEWTPVLRGRSGRCAVDLWLGFLACLPWCCWSFVYPIIFKLNVNKAIFWSWSGAHGAQILHTLRWVASFLPWSRFSSTVHIDVLNVKSVHGDKIVRMAKVELMDWNILQLKLGRRQIFIWKSLWSFLNLINWWSDWQRAFFCNLWRTIVLCIEIYPAEAIAVLQR